MCQDRVRAFALSEWVPGICDQQHPRVCGVDGDELRDRVIAGSRTGSRDEQLSLEHWRALRSDSNDLQLAKETLMVTAAGPLVHGRAFDRTQHSFSAITHNNLDVIKQNKAGSRSAVGGERPPTVDELNARRRKLEGRSMGPTWRTNLCFHKQGKRGLAHSSHRTANRIAPAGARRRHRRDRAILEDRRGRAVRGYMDCERDCQTVMLGAHSQGPVVQSSAAPQQGQTSGDRAWAASAGVFSRHHANALHPR
jgi:hypothetical protein